MKTTVVLLITSLMLLFSCSKSGQFFEDFDKYNDRIWISRDFWSIPLEDWKISDGRVEASGDHPKRKLKGKVLTMHRYAWVPWPGTVPVDMPGLHSD